MPVEIKGRSRAGCDCLAGGPDYRDPEVWAKVSGRAVYGIDLVLPGMLHGAILRSPLPHALISGVDTKRAEGMPGVRAILTGSGLGAKSFGIAAADELPLAVDKVRYIGDEVAAVAAVDRETALRAAGEIDVDYRKLPAVYDPEEALKPGAPLLHRDCPGNIAWQRQVERGDVDASLRKADLVVSDTFRVPAIHPAYLEPISCLAAFDYTGCLVLHTALQSPDCLREIVAGVLGLPESRLRVVGPAMGGGFGGRVYGNLKVYILSALLARQTGRPVKLLLSREEEFIAGRPLVAAVMEMKLALSQDGTILAREASIKTDNGAYSAQAPWVSRTLSERNDSLYRIPAIRTSVRLVYTNKVPTGQYRAYGNQVANFATESLLDMAARKLGLDPLRIRLKNCTRQGDVTVHGLQINSCALPACLEKAAAEIGWQQRKPNRGYGISAAVHASGSLVFDKDFRGASALARLELDGRVSIFTGEQDYGQGAHVVFARIAAGALGLTPGAVTVRSRDTLSGPYTQGALAMRQTTLGGRAVQLAAADLARRIEESAAGIELAAGANAAEKGHDGQGRQAFFATVARAHHSATSGLALLGEGSYVPPPADYDESGYGNISVAYSFAAHAAEVEIDEKTGKLTVHRIVAVHDSGRIINQVGAEGQVYGGVAQGLGLTCLEGYLFEGGRVANPSLAGYGVPTSLDLPVISPFFIEEEDPAGPCGAKGLGEIVMVPVPGAIANAVADAAGAWVTELPITAERIQRLLAGKGGKS